MESEIDLDDILPKEEQDIEDDPDYRFDRKVDHFFKKGALILKVNYIDDDELPTTMEVAFSILKKDVPLELAKYIHNKVIEARRGGRYNIWSKTVIKSHNRTIRRMYRQYNVNHYTKTRRAIINRIDPLSKSRNVRNAKNRNREKFGIKIPNNTRQALLFDNQNSDTK